MHAQWGIWDVTEGKWMHDPLRAPVNMSPAVYASRSEAERHADRDWRDLNPGVVFVVREFTGEVTGGAREHFARGYREGERDSVAGMPRALITAEGDDPPVIKDEDSAYYHGYKAAVEGRARSEDGAWAAYVAKHGMHTNPAHLSLDGKLSSRFGRQDASHVGFDGDFSFGVGSKDDSHMRQNAREALLDEGESIRSHMPGKTTLSLSTLSVGVPRRRRRVYAVRMGVDDRGVAMGGFHWIPASEPEEAERFWYEHTGRRVSLGGRMQRNAPYWSVLVPWSKTPTRWHPTDRTGPFSTLSRGAFRSEQEAHRWAEDNLEGQPYSVKEYDDEAIMPNAKGDVIWQDTLLTWKSVGSRGIEMIPSEHGQERALEMLEARESGHGQGLLTDQADFLEIAMGNGWSYVPPEDIGAMTDASIVSQDGFIGDDGKWYPHPEVEAPVVYAHMNYAVEDPIETWAEGKPVFWKAEVLEVSQEDRAMLRRKHAEVSGEAYEPNARKNVAAVINAFLAGRRHSEKTCSTDGWRLYSYALLIAARVDAKGEPVDVGAPGARIVVLDKKLSPSVTTSTQINSVLAAVPGAQVVDDMPYAARYLPNARKGQFKAPDSLSPAEKFFFEWAGHSYPAGASAKEQKQARVEHSKALAAAEAEAEARGWTYQWDYDQAADTSWMDEEDLEALRAGRTEMLDVLLKDENGNVLGSLGGVHVRATGGRDPYGRVVEAELAQEALDAERSAGTAMALNRGQRRQARNPVFRHMDLGEIEQILGAQEIARVMSVDRPDAHAKSRALGWWDANEPDYHDAYTNLARMLKAGVLDDLVAEARGAR